MRLASLEAEGLRRAMRLPFGHDFCSNDALSLSTHPVVMSRMMEGVKIFGAGAAGSRLVRGERRCFTLAENAFSEWKKTDDALFFGSGYAANQAVLSTFLEEWDVVFSDELNHASLIDGMRLGRARRVIFPHCDVEELARLVAETPCAGQRFLVTESLFSMGGDEAPLVEYADLCRRNRMALIVDEAHAVGVYGRTGSGLVEETGVGPDVFLSINGAGKALGLAGAFVAGEGWAIDYLVQSARGFIFSTAPVPAIAYALEESIAIVQREGERRKLLFEKAAFVRRLLSSAGFDCERDRSHIIPVIVGENRKAMDASEALRAAGYDVRAIRPPTVPVGTARLRVSVNVSLERDVIERFVKVLASTLTP